MTLSVCTALRVNNRVFWQASTKAGPRLLRKRLMQALKRRGRTERYSDWDSSEGQFPHL